MKVTLTVSRVTATAAQNRGETVEVSDAEAVRMLAAGQIEPLSAAQMKRLRRADKPETAAKPKSKR